jgi:enolase
MAAPHSSETRIAGARFRMALNSHAEWTHECQIRLTDGRVGVGTAPRGETPSVFEERTGADPSADASAAADRTSPAAAALRGLPAEQERVDDLLRERAPEWGRDVCYAASVALYEALREPTADPPTHVPGIVFNLLNGGLHAYTNPVRMDITEVLLVPQDRDLPSAIDGYRRMLDAARTALAGVPTTVVNGNAVHDLGPDGDDAALGLAGRLLADEGLSSAFRLMVDASAGDWWDGEAYRLPVSERRVERGALVARWVDLLARHDLVFLEDPMAEPDVDGWAALHDARPADRLLLGDNFTSTRIERLHEHPDLVDGVLIKPDQNGTASGAIEFAAEAERLGLVRMASHRSIETDSPFLAHLAIDLGADWLKIGPYSDFSAILRTNVLLRESAR